MRKELIECIYIGYKEGMDEEDMDDVTKLPISIDEAQYAWEFGYMMGREGQIIKESEMDEYLEQILYVCSSKLTLKDL